MTIQEILEVHVVEVGRNVFTREEWLRCKCGWIGARVLSEGFDWEPAKRDHVAEVLEKHMQEREAKAWEKGEGAGNHNTVQRLRMIQRTSHEPLITNPYADEEPSNGR